MHGKDIVQIENKVLYEAAIRLVPDIDKKMGEITEFVWGIPESYEGLKVCSTVRKQFYLKSMEMRLQQYLNPVLEKAERKLL